MSAPPTIIEAVVKKKVGSTLPLYVPVRPLSPVDMDSEEVLGGVESDEASGSEEEAESSGEDDSDNDDEEFAANAPTFLLHDKLLEDGDGDGDASDPEYVAPASPASSTTTLAPSKAMHKRPASPASTAGAEKRVKTGLAPGTSLPQVMHSIAEAEAQAQRARVAAAAGLPTQNGLTLADIDALATDAESDEASATEGALSDDGLDTALARPRALTTLLYGGSASDTERSDDSDDGSYPEPDAKGRKTRAVTKARRAARGAADAA